MSLWDRYDTFFLQVSATVHENIVKMFKNYFKKLTITVLLGVISSRVNYLGLTHKHTHSRVLRRVVTQAAARILEHHVCTINVEQFVGIHRQKDAAYVGLCGRKREREKT